MLDHLLGLSEVAFLPEISTAAFTSLHKLSASERFDAKVGTADLMARLGVVDDEQVLSDIGQTEATGAFVALIGADEKKRLAAVDALSLPESVRASVAMLTQYQWRFVEQAEHLRSMAVAKIVAHTDHPDAKIRIKALQMLGNVTEVALFTERVAVTKSDATDEDTEIRIREILSKFAARATPRGDDTIVDVEATVPLGTAVTPEAEEDAVPDAVPRTTAPTQGENA